MARLIRPAMVVALLAIVGACSNGGATASPTTAPPAVSAVPSDPAVASPEPAAWEPEQDITLIVPYPADYFKPKEA